METAKAEWASGAFTYDGSYATATRNSKELGVVQGYMAILDMDYQQIVGEIEDAERNEQLRTDALGSSRPGPDIRTGEEELDD